MEIPESIASATEMLDRAVFQKTRDKWIRPSFDLTGLKYLREKAGRERDIRELYRGRAPYSSFRMPMTSAQLLSCSCSPLTVSVSSTTERGSQLLIFGALLMAGATRTQTSASATKGSVFGRFST